MFFLAEADKEAKMIAKEKFTEQIEVSMPRNYIRELDKLSAKTNITRRQTIWDAVGAFNMICRQPGWPEKQSP